MAPQIASQRMQIPAMDIHIRKRSRVVQNIKPVRKLRRVGGLYTSLAAGLEEVLDPGMPETLNHMLKCKPYIYSCHKKRYAWVPDFGTWDGCQSQPLNQFVRRPIRPRQ